MLSSTCLKNSSFRSSFSEFAAKYAKDERFKGIEKMREREALFSDYCSDLRRKEKEEKSLQREKVSQASRRKLQIMCYLRPQVLQILSGWLIN